MLPLPGHLLKPKEQQFARAVVWSTPLIMLSLLLVVHLILSLILEGYVRPPSSCVHLRDSSLSCHHSPLALPPLRLLRLQDLALNSDQFFSLESLPSKVALIGGGYIAVELGGVLHGLGSDTSLFIRGETALRQFDPMIRTHLDFCMRRSGETIPPSPL
jgi:hypothetical protein